MESYKESFWNQELLDSSGWDIVAEQALNGKRTLAAYVVALKARAHIEEEYGKQLIKLAKQSPLAQNEGYLGKSWKAFCESNEQTGAAHKTIAACFSVQMQKIQMFAKELKMFRKPIEGNVKKLESDKKNLYEKMRKAQDDYYQKCEAVESLETQIKLASVDPSRAKEVEKFQKNLSKSERQMRDAKQTYFAYTKNLDAARKKWETGIEEAMEKFQHLEEHRIAFMRKNLWQSANAVSILCVEIDQEQDKLRNELKHCSVSGDIQNFINLKRTGRTRPLPIVYEEHRSRVKRTMSICGATSPVHKTIPANGRSKSTETPPLKSLPEVPPDQIAPVVPHHQTVSGPITKTTVSPDEIAPVVPRHQTVSGPITKTTPQESQKETVREAHDLKEQTLSTADAQDADAGQIIDGVISEIGLLCNFSTQKKAAIEPQDVNEGRAVAVMGSEAPITDMEESEAGQVEDGNLPPKIQLLEEPTEAISPAAKTGYKNLNDGTDDEAVEQIGKMQTISTSDVIEKMAGAKNDGEITPKLQQIGEGSTQKAKHELQNLYEESERAPALKVQTRSITDLVENEDNEKSEEDFAPNLKQIGQESSDPKADNVHQNLTEARVEDAAQGGKVQANTATDVEGTEPGQTNDDGTIPLKLQPLGVQPAGVGPCEENIALKGLTQATAEETQDPEIHTVTLNETGKTEIVEKITKEAKKPAAPGSVKMFFDDSGKTERPVARTKPMPHPKPVAIVAQRTDAVDKAKQVQSPPANQKEDIGNNVDETVTMMYHPAQADDHHTRRRYTIAHKEVENKLNSAQK